MMKKTLAVSVALLSVALALVIAIFVSLFIEPESIPAPVQAVDNVLTPEERDEGWRLLFDGKSLTNWHVYGSREVGPAWKATEGTLMLDVPKRTGNKAEGGGDLVTDEVFSGNFEFKADWKVTPYANSGIFFFVTEDSSFAQIYHTGLELQVTDNAIYEEVEGDNLRRAGDLFGLASSKSREVVQPAGRWNQLHVIHQEGKLKVLMNGTLIHDLDLRDSTWTDALKSSMLKDAPVSKGIYQGRIGLQDWGSTAWYRNIKIRSL